MGDLTSENFVAGWDIRAIMRSGLKPFEQSASSSLSSAHSMHANGSAAASSEGSAFVTYSRARLSPRSLSSPKNLIDSPKSRAKSSSSPMLSRWISPPHHQNNVGENGKRREPARLAQLESILDELNKRVYKPMARGRAALARKAVRPRAAIPGSQTISAWAQQPGAVLWDSIGGSWSLHDIALFEAAFALYGKDFEAVQKVVGSKTNRDIVNFFYLWKMTSHYRVYKLRTAAKNTRAKAAAMAAAMAAATAGMASITSKHSLDQFWGEKKSSKGKRKRSVGVRHAGTKRQKSQTDVRKQKSKDKSKIDKTKKSKGRKPGLLSDDKPMSSLLGTVIVPRELKRAVDDLGGIDIVREKRIWQAVRAAMKLKKTSSSGNTLNNAYKRYEFIGAFDDPQKSFRDSAPVNAPEIPQSQKIGESTGNAPSASSHSVGEALERSGTGECGGMQVNTDAGNILLTCARDEESERQIFDKQ